MKKNIHVLLLVTAATMMIISCSSGSVNIDDAKHDEINADDSVYDYNTLLKAQTRLLKDFSWPRMYELDLNDDGTAEKFLAIEGYSRGMDYALFSKKNKKWIMIPCNAPVPSGHLGIEKLDNKNQGWHDFVAYQPSGREGILESYYSWNGKQYILKEQKEVNN